ncbi:MAG: ABC transporter permease [Bacteroidales bacterium]|jgi:putative ABC transport system permease protein|nr:ABC transporter permease [Bacteroidales bacterium]
MLKIKLTILLENIKISVKSIRTNLLRTILTVLIIAIGIMALTGIMTAVESLKSTMAEQFSALGANSFSINRIYGNIINGGRKIENKKIQYNEVVRFKKDYNFPARISLSVNVAGNAIVKYNEEKTTPTISVTGTDENYMLISALEIEKGRNFSNSEINESCNFVIIGSQLQDKLFEFGENSLDKFIQIGNVKYKIIGVLKSKGASFGGNSDNICFIPLNNARQNFDIQNSNFKISVMPNDPNLLEIAISEAEGIFRNIRNLSVYDENNFEIRKSDSLIKMLMENIAVITIGASVIGFLTILGAAIGLMNIMLVSVSERTHEIGIRKALGAKSSVIKQQFLLESIIIGQLGGILGIIMGISTGNIVSLIMKTNFVVPILWIIIGFVTCFIVGIFCGYFPAVKASKLDPIEALHYE